MRKLLLPKSGFPGKIDIINSVQIPPEANSKREFIEESILEAINRYNPKLNVMEIEYSDINDQFPELPVKGGIFFGAIIEEKGINENKEEYYTNKGYTVSNDMLARRIVTYVFMLDLEMNGRNIVTQAIFPELIELMEMVIEGPCYKVANHPIYIINMLGSEIAQPSIYSPIAGMIATNMEYIEVFENTPELENVPDDIREFLMKYDPSSKGKTVYTTPEFEVNFSNKSLKIKVDKLVVGEYLEINSQNGLHKFKGSSEKFYWIKVLPYIMLAQKSHYTIDYDDLENFFNTHTPLFGNRGSKLPRFLTIINFIKKLS